MKYCSTKNCYTSTEEYNDYCYDCSIAHTISNTAKTFTESLNEGFKAMQERIESLESDVKRLKRELGLK